MKYKLSYLEMAQEDLYGAALRIAGNRDMETALAVLEEIEKVISTLAAFPYAHPLYDSPMFKGSEIRHFTIKHYTVFYTVLEPEHIVEIRRVLYDRMNADTRRL